MVPVENQIAWYTNQWHHLGCHLPNWTEKFPVEEKRAREVIALGFYGQVKTWQEEMETGMRKADAADWMVRLTQFLTQVYNFPENASGLIMNDSFLSVSRQFYMQSTEFDPLLQPAEIYQALRNVWIMNGLQLLFDMPAELTPSMFAYSLLYPYSDNLLDDPSLSAQHKLRFSDWFGRRLKGTFAEPSGYREEKISRLVSMIEQQYDREIYPEVYQSLLAIFEAQTGSIRLQSNSNHLSAGEIISLSFDKGGTSVLADGYLVAGRLTPEQQRFLFGFGIWLQLADDLQDLQEDLAGKVSTIFTRCAGSAEICENVNRAFHFGRSFIREISSFPSSGCLEFGKLMIHSVELMMLQSAGMQTLHVPSGYRQQLEEYAPLRFDFLLQMKKKGNGGRFKMITRLLQSAEFNMKLRNALQQQEVSVRV